MLKKHLTLAGLLIGFSINALAEDWSSIITKPDYEIQVDLDSYKMMDGYPSIVTKTIFNDVQESTIASNKVAYNYQVENTQFNCKEPRYKVTQATFYDAEDKALGASPTQTKFNRIENGSDAFSVGQLVCQVHRMVGGN